MSLATNLAIVGIALAAFFGLGGVQKTKSLFDDLKGNETISKIIDNTRTTPSPSPTVTNPQPIPQPTPTKQQDTERINTIIRNITIDSRNPPISQPARINPVSREIVTQTQPQRRQSERELTKSDPFLTRSTSLEGAQLSTGPQIKRGTSKFNEVKAEEARRAEEIFKKLFGNVGNPNF